MPQNGTPKFGKPPDQSPKSAREALADLHHAPLACAPSQSSFLFLRGSGGVNIGTIVGLNVGIVIGMIIGMHSPHSLYTSKSWAVAFAFCE